LLLSRYGALIACQHAVEVGEMLSVARLDTRGQAQARVAWILRQGPGRLQIGVEFHEHENFWELDWRTIEAAEPN
jgi:ribulose bisphosphate carboxylase small subunit